jgi:hypothetical protein
MSRHQRSVVQSGVTFSYRRQVSCSSRRFRPLCRDDNKTPMNVAPAPKWRLKLLTSDGEHEADRLFYDLRALLGAARQLREERPELRLVVTIPSEASEEDRDFLKQIASRLP